jgi:hypothetical protein
MKQTLKRSLTNRCVQVGLDPTEVHPVIPQKHFHVDLASNVNDKSTNVGDSVFIIYV